MKAVVFTKRDSSCFIEEIDKPKPQAGEVLVEIHSAALNRRDLWIKKGIYQGAEFPCVVGSDASGIVVEAGDKADESWLNKPVVINPAMHWGDNPGYHGPDFQIVGLPEQGTLAQYICVPVENIYSKPEAWTFQEASALPLAGLTAYRALFTRGQLSKGEKILITGIGGGVAGFLMRFALTVEADVFVSSGSQGKIDRALESGVKSGVLYSQSGWDKELLELSEGGFDLIVDSAAGENFGKLLGLLKTGGRIVNFGGTTGKIPPITAAKIFWRQASILGTTMGSPQDFKAMLEFVQKYHIKPGIDKTFPLEDAEAAFQYMSSQSQFGKIVIQIR